MISLAPRYAEAYNELGASLRRQSEHGNAEAEDSFLKALSLNPKLAVAHYNLALVQRDSGRTGEAVEHLRQAVDLQPLMVKAQEAFGLLLRDLGLLHEAVIHYRKALQHLPDEPSLWLEFGYCLKDVGELAEAAEKYRHVLKLLPGNVDALAGLAQLAERQGRFDECYELVRPSIEGGTGNVNIALAYVAVAKHLGLQQQAVSLCERLLAEDKPDSERRLLHHSLGQLFNDGQEYDLAFHHFKSANDVDRNECERNKKEAAFGRLHSVFTAERLARLPRASNKSVLPVFIVGMPRSGTSLVEQIMASHPEVHGAGELPHLGYIEARLPSILGDKKPYPECVEYLQADVVDALADEYLQKLAGHSADACRVTDKMPHNFLRLGLIDLLFPGAHVIHCLRDPLDTCLSIYSMPFNRNHLYAADLAALGKYCRLYQRLMAHWRQVVRVPLLEVRYEDMVADQEAVAVRLSDFAGCRGTMSACASMPVGGRSTR